jgi:hypothetical protein
LGHAKKAGCVCKHVCFILSRVLKYTDESFYDDLTFNFEQVRNLCECLHIEDNLINLTLLDRYIDLTENKPDFTKYREFKEDTECPICYTELGNNEQLLGCPVCLNPVHTKCMEKWLTIKQSCSYCRNEIWERYNDHNTPLKL